MFISFAQGESLSSLFTSSLDHWLESFVFQKSAARSAMAQARPVALSCSNLVYPILQGETPPKTFALR